MIINHTDCGMMTFTDSGLEQKLEETTGQAPVAPARFYSFSDLEENTREQIQRVRTHPWIPRDIPVRGFVYDVFAGKLREVMRENGRRAAQGSGNQSVHRRTTR